MTEYEVIWREPGAKWTKADGSPFDDVQVALNWIHADVDPNATADAGDWFAFQNAMSRPGGTFRITLPHITGPMYEYEIRRHS